jgi:acetyl-CoA carboxylase biotin carboxyl carrier protein
LSTVPSGDIEAMVTLFRESGWREMHLQANGVELFLSKDGNAQVPRHGAAPVPLAAQAPAAPAPATVAPAPALTPVPVASNGPTHAALAENCVVIRAPSLGTFYRSPKPGAAPFCEVGQTVGTDDQLCLIEVMKLFTTVRAGLAGTIREICAADGEMVEFDQPLFVIQQ